MCYEQRLFRFWTRQKAHEREQIKPEEVRARPEVQPIRPAPGREKARREEVERELEQIV